jgi:hypothetical protein
MGRCTGANMRNLNREEAEELSPDLPRTSDPSAAGNRVAERFASPSTTKGIGSLAQGSYPQAALLKRVKGTATEV